MKTTVVTPVLLGEPTFDWLEARSKLHKRFAAFSMRVPPRFKGVAGVMRIGGNRLIVVERLTNRFVEMEMALLRMILLLTVCSAQPPASVKVIGIIKQLQAGPTRFELAENEVNQHIVYSLKTTPRPGIESLLVKFFDGNYVSTYTTVDFDAVEKWKPGTIPMMLRPVLSGKKAIWVDIRFYVNNAHATYKIEKAYYEKIPIPAFALEKAIQVLAARQPEKYDTTKPVPLPFGMTKLSTKAQRIAGEK